MVLTMKKNLSLKISYLGFGYQNDLVSILVYNYLVTNYNFFYL